MSGRVIQALSKALTDDEKECQCCGFNYIHICAVAVKQGEKLTVIDGERVVTCPVPNNRRGSDVAIEYRCEEGCCFVELFRFHKGNVFVDCVKFDCDFEEPIENLWRD